VTIFLSAFLLFQAEFIFSKYLLPWFGGTAALWTTTMLVFQSLLFAGYAYAHFLSTRFEPGSQVRLHLALLAVCTVLMVVLALRWPSPISPGASWKPQTPQYPVLSVIFISLIGVGLPFFTLSTTSPLLQGWYRISSTRSPYRLYAVSNIGSLAGLFSYPTVIEPLVKLRMQAWGWSCFYGLFVLGVLVCAASARNATINLGQLNEVGEKTPKPSWNIRSLWLVLATCSTVALLAFTNMMSQYVAAVPLLWAIPLALYLISFILCFGRPHWYRRGFYLALYGAASVATLMAIATPGIRFQLLAFSVLLFAICMLCHGELVRIAPAPDHLTSFYLSISAGGAVGGFLVAGVGPAVLSRFWEFEFSIVATGVLTGLMMLRDTESSHRLWPILTVPGIVFGLGLGGWRMSTTIAEEFRRLHYFEVAATLVPAVVIVCVVLSLGPRKASRISPAAISVFACAALFAYTFSQASWGIIGTTIARARGFYGTIEVQEQQDRIVLVHGKTMHGAQLKAPALRNLPITYYSASSGIGEFLRSHPKRNPPVPMRLGVVGLGVGTLAAYGLPGDYLRFYEIDPDVVNLTRGSKAIFTYLNDSGASVDIVLGDGRISLEREALANQPQHFDILILDAFSGDAVPIHLLTREAFSTYLRHLTPDGTLAVHISSLTFDLTPVLLGAMRDLDLYGTVVYDEGSEEGFSSVWVILAKDPSLLNSPGLRQRGSALSAGRMPVQWTDDYSNLMVLLK